MGSVKEVGEGAEKKMMEKTGSKKGCWISRIGSCFLRPRVDVPGAGVLCARAPGATVRSHRGHLGARQGLSHDRNSLFTSGEENMSKNDGSRDQPAVPVFSGSTTVSNAGSNTSPPKLGDELNFASQLLRFSFSELKFATRDFMPQSFLGRGGFGCVFKGWIEENGTAPVRPGEGLTVAVKKLNHGGLQGHKEWLAEVNFLSDLHHPNLVKLFGYCIEDDQRLLVYEFMPRGSLENHLFRRILPPPWHFRVKIEFGAAKGLAFLHEEAERPVIFRDFKSSNILLDSDYNAKLSDFGLAKDGPVGDKTHISTRVMGTYGYTAPEYVMTGHLTSKSDVYSFGVVLLEMLTGRMPIDSNRPRGKQILVEWARPYLREGQQLYRLFDPRLGGNYSIRGCQKVAQVARHCLSRDPKARPRMSEVVEALKPVLYLRDMANSQFYQNMNARRAASSTNNQNTRDGLRTHGSFKIQTSATRNGQMPAKSLSIDEHASPYNPSLDINGSNLECTTSGISPS